MNCSVVFSEWSPVKVTTRIGHRWSSNSIPCIVLSSLSRAADSFAV